MRKFILILFVISHISVFSQKVQVGVGLNYDMGISYKETSNYKLESDIGNSSLGLEFFLKIPVKRFNVYPAFDFTWQDTEITLLNPYGTHGDMSMQVPYSTVGNGWSLTHSGSNYKYWLSDGFISQKKIGAYITKSLHKDSFTEIEIGSGLFYNMRKMRVQSYHAYNKYLWYGSTGTKYDNYSWDETIVLDDEPYKVEEFYSNNLELPLIIQYTMGDDSYSSTFSFITFLGSDIYCRLRVTMGLGIFNLKNDNKDINN